MRLTLIVALLIALAKAAVAYPVPRDMLEHCTGCDLRGVDLRGRDLHAIRLVGMDLERADLRNADLRDTEFTGVDLRDAKLDGANLTNAKFTGSSLEGATFAGATMTGVQLIGIRLNSHTIDALGGLRGAIRSCTGCDLRDVSLHGRDLSDVRFTGVDLNGSDVSGTRFVRARLVGVTFRGGTARRTDFTDGFLIGTDFRSTDLQGAILRNAVLCVPSTREENGVRTEGSIHCADFAGAKLNDADLRGVRFCHTDRDAPRDCRAVTPDELRTLAHADIGTARVDR